MILPAATVLLTLGACDERACSALDLDERAHAILVACGEDLPSALTGMHCVELAAVVWAMESGGQFLEYPSGRWRGSGVGPFQIVQPTGCFHNSRIGRVCLPPHELFGGPDAVAHGVWLLRVKAARSRTYRELFLRWNGSAGAERYADRAVRLMRRVR